MFIKYKKLSIRTLIFISIITSCSIIILILFTSTHVSSATVFTDLVDNYSMAKVNDLSMQLDAMIERNINLCCEFQNDSTIQYYAKTYPNLSAIDQLDIENKISENVNYYWKIRPEIYSIKFFFENKKYNSTVSDKIYPLELMRSQKWFQDIMSLSNTLIVTDRYDASCVRNIGTANHLITSVAQIYDQNNACLGYVTVDISIDYIVDNLLVQNKSSKDSTILIVNNNDELIMPNLSDRELIKNDAIKLAVQNKNSGYKNITYNKLKMLLSYSKTSPRSWKVFELIPVNSLPSFSKNINRTAFFSILLVIFLSLIIASLFSKSISKPIVELSSLMNNFKKSDVNFQSNNSYTNEIEILNQSYHSLLNRVDTLLSEQKDLNEQKKRAEIKALQAQINPHFLYNVLDSISWNALIHDVPDISEMLKKLGCLYRISLYKGLDVCYLKDELLHVSLYMDLQKQCFDSTFDYKIEIDEKLMKLYVPRFILQPIIENCIIHGFSNKKINGMIKIFAYIDHQLYITISDNGKGISGDMIQQLNNQTYKTDRYGIYNVSERLNLICGKNYYLHYDSEFAYGTTVTFILPIINNIDDFDQII